jgi:hypothetical protein
MGAASMARRRHCEVCSLAIRGSVVNRLKQILPPLVQPRRCWSRCGGLLVATKSVIFPTRCKS